MLPIIISPEADFDTDNFYFYIAEENLNSANRFLQLLEQTYYMLAEFPEVAPIFPTDESKLADLRWFPVKDFPNHLIFYRYHSEQIEIIRLFHKAQDIVTILDE